MSNSSSFVYALSSENYQPCRHTGMHPTTDEASTPGRVMSTLSEKSTDPATQFPIKPGRGSPSTSQAPTNVNVLTQLQLNSARTVLPPEHPVWFCKRDNCEGVLTLLGRMEPTSGKHQHIDDLRAAKLRANAKRQLYPLTYTHGDPLSCSLCGAHAHSLTIQPKTCAFF